MASTYRFLLFMKLYTVRLLTSKIFAIEAIGIFFFRRVRISSSFPDSFTLFDRLPLGLPNLLLSKPAYPELIQSKCTAKEINYHMMESHNKVSFSNEIKATLKGDGFDSVAQEILSLS